MACSTRPLSTDPEAAPLRRSLLGGTESTAGQISIISSVTTGSRSRPPILGFNSLRSDRDSELVAGGNVFVRIREDHIGSELLELVGSSALAHHCQ